VEEFWVDWNRHLLYQPNIVLAESFWQIHHQKLEHRVKAADDLRRVVLFCKIKYENAVGTYSIDIFLT
jgi:hypothetical protein